MLFSTETVRRFELIPASVLLTSHAATFPTAPSVKISEKGDIVATEAACGVGNLEAYVNGVNASINVDKGYVRVLKPWNVVQFQPGIGNVQVNQTKDLCDPVSYYHRSMGPKTSTKASSQYCIYRASRSRLLG